MRAVLFTAIIVLSLAGPGCTGMPTDANMLEGAIQYCIKVSAETAHTKLSESDIEKYKVDGKWFTPDLSWTPRYAQYLPLQCRRTVHFKSLRELGILLLAINSDTHYLQQPAVNWVPLVRRGSKQHHVYRRQNMQRAHEYGVLNTPRDRRRSRCPTKGPGRCEMTPKAATPRATWSIQP